MTDLHDDVRLTMGNFEVGEGWNFNFNFNCEFYFQLYNLEFQYLNSGSPGTRLFVDHAMLGSRYWTGLTYSLSGDIDCQAV